MISFICLLTFIIIFTLSINAEVINKEVIRSIDATSSIVRVTTEIKVSNVNKEYKLIFSNYQANYLAYISASIKGKASVELPTTAPVT